MALRDSSPFGRALLCACLVVFGCVAVASDRVNLRFTLWDGDQSLAALRGAIHLFEERYPNIHVDVEPVDYNNYFSKLLVQIAGNVAPDVVMLDPPNFQKFATRGALLNLNDLYQADRSFDIREYYEPIVKAMTVHGALYALPRDIAPEGIIYYNKRLFDEAGIPYPDGSWTWDFHERPELKEKDFLWVLHHLTKTRADGPPTQFALALEWPGVLVDSLVYSTGGWYGDDMEHPTKMGYTDPHTVAAYQLLADLMFKYQYIPSPTMLSQGLGSNGNQEFLKGHVAMYLTGIWATPIIRETLVPGSKAFFDWDVAPVPAYKDGTLRIPTGGSGYGIVSSTKHPHEAWLLTKWMAGPPGMMAMAKAGIAQPAIRKLALQEPWIPGPHTPVDQQYPHNRIITDRLVPHVVFSPTADYWGECTGLAQVKIDNIWQGSDNAAHALRAGQMDGEKRLHEILTDRTRGPYDWRLGAVAGGLLLLTGVGWVYWPERRIQFTRKEKAESRAAYLFILPWILGMLIFTLGPMILSLLMSLSKWDIISQAQWKGVGNFTDAVTDQRMLKSLEVTTIYTAVSIPIGLLGALLLALLLNLKVKGMPLFRTFFYLPSLASAVAGSLIWLRVFQQNGGMLNTLIYGNDGRGDFLGLAHLLQAVAPPHQPVNWLGNEKTALASMIIMSIWGVGAGMVILLAGLQGIPQFYYEAATLDGARSWAKFKAVTLPLLSPALFFSLVTGMIGSFQVFAQSYVMTSGGPNDATRFYMLHLWEAAFKDLRMGYASALAWILFFVILVLTLVQLRLQRYVYYEGGSR